MQSALALARRGRYSTSPNPAVGCVIVKDGLVIAEGYHAAAGQPHAEAVALSAAGDSAEGATAYVTLEPCNHHGRTGPCAEALIDSRVTRVVYAVDDPGREAGGGAARLRQAGIEVSGGVCADEASWLNRGFLKRAREGRPWVRLKIAMSLDAKVAMASGESQWITGESARADVQRLRAESCSVMTGIGTLLADDPGLNVRDPSLEMRGRQPMRVVLDDQLRTPTDARLLSLPGQTHILTVSGDESKRENLTAAGADVAQLPAADDARVDINSALDYLGRHGVNHVLVEAGSTLVSNLLNRDLYDELVIYVAPRLLGSDARAAFELDAVEKLADARRLKLASTWQTGDDVALNYIRGR